MLVLSLNHTHPTMNDIHTMEYVFTNHLNGTYSLTFFIYTAGILHLRVRNNKTGEFFLDEYSTTISPAGLAIDSCYVNSVIPQTWPLQKWMHLEIVLVDMYGTLVCDEKGRYEVRMDIEIQNTYMNVGNGR